jgi:hypothetical protein
MQFQEPLQNRKTEEIIGGVYMLECVLSHLYEAFGEHLQTQEEFNNFADRYTEIALMPQAMETVLEVLKDELNNRGIDI